MSNDYLDFKKARVDYRDMLMPPEGYEVECAVGTTYSLDLQALLTVPLAFGATKDIGEDVENINKLYALSAILETKKKFMIFCNSTSILSPKRNQETLFHSLMDDCVYPIYIKGGSFHPKVWIILYKKHGECKSSVVRIAVLSRNLTFDQSLDVITYFDGKIDYNLKGNRQKELCEFIEFLKKTKNLRKQQKNKLDDLSTCVSKVSKFDYGQIFDGVRFHAFFPKNEQPFKAKDLCQKDVVGLGIVSPFLSKDEVNHAFGFRSDIKIKRLLVTRSNCVLSKKSIFGSKDILGFKGDGEFKENDIHAKIIFQERKKGKADRLFLGSLNLTQSAFNNNVEFMAEFSFAQKMRFEKFKEIFSNGPFEPLTLEKNDNPSNKRVNIFDSIVSTFKKGVVSGKPGKYTIKLFFGKCMPEYSIAPLNSIKIKPKKIEKKAILFSNLNSNEVTDFFIVKRGGEERVIKLSLKNKPKDRDDYIKKSFLNNDANLLEYIMMQLPGANVIKGPPTGPGPDSGTPSFPKMNSYFEDDLYERLLKMMDDSACLNRFKELNNSIKDLSDNKSDSIKDLENLKKMIAHFYKAAKSLYGR